MARRTVVQERRRPRGAEPLSRERILEAAIDLADRDGIDSLSMRRLADALGVDPMSLYNHVRDKGDLLDGVADRVVAEIELPEAATGDWAATMRATILSARNAMLRHPWVAGVVASRVQPGPATMRYMDAVFGILLDGGFSIELSHHALHVLGSRVLGFTQDLWNDSPETRADPETQAIMARQLAAAFPRLGELAMAASHEGGLGGCDDDIEFAFGLDLILDGLERRRRSAAAQS
jgi:AcrR family transcriptional regulator